MATTTNLGLNKPARTDNINVVTAINNNMDVLDAAIGALPSGSNLQTEISGKADKVASPTNGNFAGLDGNGNLTDSGKKAADFATASEVGTVPSGKTVQGQISDIESDIGTVPSGKTVQGQITDIESSIGTVPSGKTVEGQISEINTTVGSMIDDTSTANNKVWSAQKVNDLKSALTNTVKNIGSSNLIEWELGGYKNADGDEESTVYFIRTQKINVLNGYNLFHFSVTDSTWQYRIYEYSNNGTFIKHVGNFNYEETFYFENDHKIAISFHLAAGSPAMSDTSISSNIGITELPYANLMNKIDNIEDVANNYNNILNIPIVLGNVSISSGGWSYSESSTRVRTPVNYTIHLNAGDIVTLTNFTDRSFYLGWIKDGDGTYGVKGWITKPYTIEESGKYIILISKADGEQYLKIYRSDNTVSRLQNLEELSNSKQVHFDYGLEFELGSIDNTGAEIYRTTRIRTPHMKFDCPMFLMIADGYRYQINTYYGDGTFKQSAWQNWNDYLDYHSDCTYRLTVSKQDDAVITPANTGDKLKMCRFYNGGFTKGSLKGLNPKTITLVNHRGLNGHAPECTIPAYKLSSDVGFTYVEGDVVFTSDSVPVINHTKNILQAIIDYNSLSYTHVSDYTYDQIRTYDWGGWFGEEFENTKIPSFDEFISFCKRNGLVPYIDLKELEEQDETHIQILANIVKSYAMEDVAVWLSFYDTGLNNVKAEMPNARIGLNVSTISASTISYIASKTNAFINADKSNITDALLGQCKEAGVEVQAWTVNTRDNFDTLCGKYISGVTSDYISPMEFA